MALPNGVSARVPAPSIKPSLETPLYSEALGFTAYPNEWLPFGGAKQATVFSGAKPVGHLSSGPGDEFTASVITEESLQVRYALSLGQGWTVEQGIEVIEWDGDSLSDVDVGEDSDD